MARGSEAGVREGVGGLVFNVHRVSVWEDEKFLEVDVVMVAQQYECT